MTPDAPDSLFEELFRPSLIVLAKAAVYGGALTVVWVGSGLYQRQQLAHEMDLRVHEALENRVRPECQRPSWVHTREDASEYDKTLTSMTSVENHLDALQQRAAAIKQKASQMEDLQHTLQHELERDLLQSQSRTVTLQLPAAAGGPGTSY